MNEGKATGSKLCDSSVLLAYFIDGRFKEIIEEEQVLISSLSIFETKRRLLEKGESAEKIDQGLELVRNLTHIIDVDKTIAEKAATISYEKKLPAIDSLIYACALLNEAQLLTLDNDFRGLQNAVIL